LLLVKPGERLAERALYAYSVQEPPRSTWDGPDTGPSGFVDGLTE
jgi:hypothetical protein